MRSRATDLELEVRRRDSAFHDGLSVGGADDHHRGALRAKGLLVARRRHGPEQDDGRGPRRIEPVPAERTDDVGGAVARGADQAAQDRRRGRVTREAERLVVLAAGRGEDGELGVLTAVEVADGEPVVRVQRDDRRRAAPHAVRLPRRVVRDEARDEKARALDGGHDGGR